LKLKYGETLSIVAFNFNLRRDAEDFEEESVSDEALSEHEVDDVQVRDPPPNIP
jgi:hypothetical protein